MKVVCVSGVASWLTFCAFLAVSGPSLAAVADGRPVLARSPVTSKPAASVCANRVLLATGGLCCPLPQSTAGRCSQAQHRLIDPAMARLQPLRVNGVTIPLVIVAQVVDKGLHRSWSPAIEDRNQVVCRFGDSSSRFPALHCLSNKTHFRNPVTQHLNYDPASSKIDCYSGCFLTQGDVAVSIVRYINSDAHRATLVSSLLSRMPKRRASYTLRIPETVPMRFPSLQDKILNYPVFVTFSITKGELSNIELSKRDVSAGQGHIQP